MTCCYVGDRFLANLGSRAFGSDVAAVAAGGAVLLAANCLPFVVQAVSVAATLVGVGTVVRGGANRDAARGGPSPGAEDD